MTPVHCLSTCTNIAPLNGTGEKKPRNNFILKLLIITVNDDSTNSTDPCPSDTLLTLWIKSYDVLNSNFITFGSRSQDIPSRLHFSTRKTWETNGLICCLHGVSEVLTRFTFNAIHCRKWGLHFQSPTHFRINQSPFLFLFFPFYIMRHWLRCLLYGNSSPTTSSVVPL